MKSTMNRNAARLCLVLLISAFAASCADEDSGGDGSDGQVDCDQNFHFDKQTQIDRISHCMEVRGLTLSYGDFTAINLPFLQAASWIDVRENPDLTSLELPALTETYEDLYVGHNPSLVDLDLSSLEDANSDIAVVGTAIESLALPSFESGNLRIGENESLIEITAAELSKLYFIELYSNPSLTTVSFDSLSEITGEVYIDSCPALTSLDAFAGLTGVGEYSDQWPDFGGLIVTNNSGLTSLGLTSWTQLTGELRIQDNAALPTCQATELRDALEIDGTVCISGNAADTCEDNVSDEC
jgi:hypothetical protein